MLLQIRNYKDYNNYKDLSSYQISTVSFVWVKVSNNFHDIMIWSLDLIQAGTFPFSTQMIKCLKPKLFRVIAQAHENLKQKNQQGERSIVPLSSLGRIGLR